MDQERWPRGTPVAPGGHGPGGGRFRDMSPDWTSLARGGGPMAAMDYSAAVTGGWAARLASQLGNGPYRPGRWEQVDVREHMAERWGRLVGALQDDGLPEREAIGIADQMFYEYSPPRRVLRNGPYEVVLEHGVREDLPEGDLLRLVDALVMDYPPAGSLRLSIVPARNNIVGGGGVTLRHNSDTVTSDPIIILGDAVFDEDLPTGETWAMRHITESVPWIYVLTHEWGHTRTNGDRGAPLAREHADSLTEYGRRSAIEASAEAFAEWVLSGGLTNNAAAIAYAELYGWRRPSWQG